MKYPDGLVAALVLVGSFAAAVGITIETVPRLAAEQQEVRTTTCPANDSHAISAEPKIGRDDAHEIGAIERSGEHKGEIYGGVYPRDNKPIWFVAAPKMMDHYAAAAWAEEQGGSLPTRKQGYYLTTLRCKGGAFTEIFNRKDGPSLDGWIWLAELNADHSNEAWSQRLRNGFQKDDGGRIAPLSVLSVRR